MARTLQSAAVSSLAILNEVSCLLEALGMKDRIAISQVVDFPQIRAAETLLIAMVAQFPATPLKVWFMLSISWAT